MLTDAGMTFIGVAAFYSFVIFAFGFTIGEIRMKKKLEALNK